MIGLLVLLGALAGAAAFDPAAEAPRFHRAAQGFHEPGADPVGPAAGALALAQTVRLSAGCTAVYVSPEGYALTSAHCLEGELPGGTGREERGTAVAYGGARVRATVHGLPVTLVASGVDVDSDWRANEGMALEARRAALAGDWALIRVERTGEAVCAVVSEDAPGPGRFVWSVGYPARTAGRLPGTDAPGGAEARMTHGLVSQSLPAGSPPRLRRVLEPLLASRAMLLSDADHHEGMSGSPVFDEHGRLVALGSLSIGDMAGAYRPDVSVSITMRRIVLDLRAAGLPAERWLSCPAAGRPGPRI